MGRKREVQQGGSEAGEMGTETCMETSPVYDIKEINFTKGTGMVQNVPLLFQQKRSI